MAAILDLFEQHGLLMFELEEPLLADRARSFGSRQHQVDKFFNILLKLHDMRLIRFGAFLLGSSFMRPKVLEHRDGDFPQAFRGRHCAEQMSKFAFNLGARNRLTLACATALEAEVVGVTFRFPLGPTRC